MPDDTLTYDPELASGYFVQIRSDFLRSPAFTPTAKVLYLVLCSYAGAGETAWPGQERLATECAVSERTIRRVMDELEAAKLVAVKQRGLNKPNLYHLHKLPVLDRTNWPLRDRTQSPIKSGQPARSRADSVTAELHTVETHTEQVDETLPASPLPEQTPDTAGQSLPSDDAIARMRPEERLAHVEAMQERQRRWGKLPH